MQQEKKKNRTLAKVGIATLFIAVAGLGIAAFAMKKSHDEFKEQAELDQNQLIKKFDNSYQQIEKNLFEITAHENILRANFSGNGEMEGPMTAEERIARETQIIQSLIEENEQLIGELQAKLGERDAAVLEVESKNRRLKRDLKSFKAQIGELQMANLALTDSLTTKEIQNKELMSNLEMSQVEKDSLNANLMRQNEAYMEQEMVKSELKTKLNTSYYVVGAYKDLAQMDVVEKEGGILGLGATKELKEDFDQAQFTAINKNEFTMIPVFAKKAELATTHPTGSYAWVENENGVQWLEIKQPENFWEQSKYLVVLTDKK